MIRRSLTTLSAAVLVVGAGAVVSAAAADPAKPSHPGSSTLAAAPDGAANGGAVIVVLKDQYKTGRLKALSTTRKTAVAQTQAPVAHRLKAAGAKNLRGLVGVNAVAGRLSAAQVTTARKDPAVAKVVPDVSVPITTKTQPAATTPAAINRRICPTNPAKPLLEPEALSVMHVDTSDNNDPDQAKLVATGKGVTVAIDGMNELAGNPNFIRPDGSHVVIDAPQPYQDAGNDESYGDASSVAAQGTVTYDFSKELPYSGLPAGCTFRIKGVAPDAALVDTTNIPDYGSANGPTSVPLSTIVAGIDRSVVVDHADVISESYGVSGVQTGGLLDDANDAAVAAGVTVVVSSGDEGVSGTYSSPASDPNVIGVGATNTLRLTAQAYGYKDWTNNDITPLSSGGPAQNGKLVDVVAPGYGGEAACNPVHGEGCPSNTQTEAFGGTSQSAPFVAGAAADVIQAYSDSHQGAKPTPAMVKQILGGSAQDGDAPADQQGAGLVNVYAAVRAAQQEPAAQPAVPASDSTSLIPSPSQLDVVADGGATSKQSVSVYNTGASPARVTPTLRSFGAATQLGSTVTEKVSAPDPSQPVAAEGATAAAPITFSVPAGVDRIDADMIWPDPTNNNILSFTLVDPKGRLTQISYDYGNTYGPHQVPNDQHVEVAHPVAGKWTAKILWANGRAHLQNLPNVPGTYTGDVSFKVSTRQFVTHNAGSAVTIPAHSSATVPVNVKLPTAPGDAPESLQMVGSNGGKTSLPISRRTLIPSAGGSFTARITSTVGRPQSVAQVSTFNIDVPAGKKDLDVAFHTPDASPDNVLNYYLLDPSGKKIASDQTPTATQQGIGADKPAALASLTATNPVAGRWEIDVVLKLTVSGKEFTQAVHGTVGYDQAQVTDYDTLPTSSATTIPAGSATPIDVSVTNTTGVGRTFTLQGSAGDVTGAATTTGVYIPAGTTALLTATLTPTAAVGTVVTGTLAVRTAQSDRSHQVIASFPYSYTVGPAKST